MSAYSRIKTEFKDTEALIGALRDMGYLPAVHEKAVRLEGYEGDLRQERAEIVIPRSQVGDAANDIGFTFRDGVWEAIISEYDQRLTFHDERQEELQVHYNMQLGVRKCLQNGMMIVSKEKPRRVNGKLVARIQAVPR